MERRALTAEDLLRLTRAFSFYLLTDRLAPEEIAASLPSLEVLAYPEGAQIVRQGEATSDLYIISRGRATIVRDGRMLSRLAAGDIFGELGGVDDASRPRSATVVAGDRCEVFRCSAAEFAEMVKRRPDLKPAMRSQGTMRLRRPAP